VSSVLNPTSAKFEGVRRPKGFSLLEVVLASVIFLTALLLMTSLWTAYHKALTQSRNRLVANGLARSVMEQRLAAGHGSLEAILGTPQSQTFVSNSQVRGRRLTQEFQSSFLATDPMGAGTVLRRLVVTVSWEESSGKKELVYESCLFKTQ
jgi:prepilin-type N-terminal cleavage/methylation domain-containing protein